MRQAFLRNVRRALGRDSGGAPSVAEVPAGLSPDARSVGERARKVREVALSRADELMAQLASSAAQAGWAVARAATAEEAARHVEAVTRAVEARLVVRSAHPALERLGIEAALRPLGASVRLIALGDAAEGEERERRRQELRQDAAGADLGITGVDYAVAETGTCVVWATKGASRLVSLLPPVYVAVVERGQVLPSLDELFTLEREALRAGRSRGYSTLITGPSRSGDIEQTLVTGVHGPGEVHMLLVG